MKPTDATGAGPKGANRTLSGRSFASRIAGGAAWAMAGSVIAQSCGLLTAVIAARLLGKAAFGRVAILQSTALMLASVAGAGLGITATRYLARFRCCDPGRAGRLLGLIHMIAYGTGLLFAGGLVLVSPVLSAVCFQAPELSPYLRIASLQVFFLTLNGFQTGALIGLEAFRRLATVYWVQGIAGLAAAACLIPHFGLAGAAWAMALGTAAPWAYSRRALDAECVRQGIRICYRRVWRERAVFSEFALPAALSGIVGQVAIWSSNAILIRLGGGVTAMALFSAANSFRQLVLFAPSILTRVAMPVLCNLHTHAETGEYHKSFATNIRLNTSLAVLTAVLLATAGPQLTGIFGRGFGNSGALAGVLAASGVLEVFSATLFQALVSHGKIWWQAATATAWSACLVAITYAAAPGYGASALAGGYLGAWLVSAMIYGAMAHHLRRQGTRVVVPQELMAGETI